MPGPLRRLSVLLLVLCGLILVYFGLRLHHWGEERSWRIAVLRDDLGSSRKSSLLAKMGLPVAIPRQKQDASVLIDAARKDALPLADSAMRVVAIRVADEDLHDPETGLKAHSRERGRNWERPAGVVVMQNGRELLAAPAGIRLQGNRDTRDMLHSFRLYFRNSYGQKNVPGAAFLDDSKMKIRKVVTRTEKNLIPGFVNMLAFDVARRIGSITPDYAPILLCRNGENLGLGLASEHVNRTHWERKLGHKDFAFYMLESENSVLDTARYKALRLRVDPFFGLWDYDRMSGILDMSDFMNAMTTFAFLQWQDWNQGAFLLDETETAPRWRSVLWDADLAFAGLRANGIPANRAGWKNFRDAHGMRASVFKGMWDSSPRFREEMLWRLTRSINHRLTREWITERVDHYARLEKETGIECFDEELALSYLLERRALLMAESVAELQAPEVVACHVQSPEPVLIDGQDTPGEYEGLYFQGQKVTLEPRPDRDFSHWIVDGRTILQRRLELALEHKTQIRAVFLPSKPGS
ncbi:MAG: CotH kinase family protein [Desulfomicrobium apsheronum]|nr:CotH kinase family protein [Desulfomicrobium apsheronum]